jgi:hypothetical protein
MCLVITCTLSLSLPSQILARRANEHQLSALPPSATSSRDGIVFSATTEFITTIDAVAHEFRAKQTADVNAANAAAAATQSSKSAAAAAAAATVSKTDDDDDDVDDKTTESKHATRTDAGVLLREPVVAQGMAAALSHIRSVREFVVRVCVCCDVRATCNAHTPVPTLSVVSSTRTTS